jgi:hypothetical protein
VIVDVNERISTAMKRRSVKMLKRFPGIVFRLNASWL